VKDPLCWLGSAPDQASGLGSTCQTQELGLTNATTRWCLSLAYARPRWYMSMVGARLSDI